MPRPISLLVLAIVALIFGILVLVEGFFQIPAMGLYTGTKTTLWTVIGSLGIIAGLLYVATFVGLWKMARWGWIFGITASVVAVGHAIWVYLNVLDFTVPIAELVVIALILTYLAVVRSAFSVEEASTALGTA